MARKDAQPGKSEEMAERRVKAFNLRKAGANYRDIAKQLGVTHSTIVQDVKAVMKELQKEQVVEADSYRTMELERLDAMQTQMWSQVQKGNQGAVDRVLRIMERRAKLLGLDAPTKVDGKFEVFDPYSEAIKAARASRNLESGQE
jgi:transcriptional regulator